MCFSKNFLLYFINELINLLSESIISWASNSTTQAAEGEDQNISTPLVALGSMATVGMLHYLNKKIGIVDHAIGYFNRIFGK